MGVAKQEPSALEFLQTLLDPVGQGGRLHSDHPEVDELVRAVRERGWQIEWRAKRAGVSRLFWARVLDHDGREISACGGWYQNCEKAICKAIERPLLLLQASRPGALQLWAKKPVTAAAAARSDALPRAAIAST